MSRARGTPPSKWATTLFDCFGGPDTGFNCCVQQCCCQPCVWGDALRRAGVADSSFFTFLVICGGRSALDETASFFGRRRLLEKYGIEESSFESFFASCCCSCCARVQEVNTVMEREKNLKYGCASLEPTVVSSTVVTASIVPIQMDRSRRSSSRV